jgi:two-component system sensor histidine kinase MprB
VAWDALSRLRYRRSLASRVIALTTLLVALSVALVALAAYFTVRHQLMASLDESLHERAEVSAAYDPSEYYLGNIPAFVTGATDTKVGYLAANGTQALTRGPYPGKLPLGAPELAVARGADRYSCRTISAGGYDFRVATARTGQAGVALVVAQSLESDERTLGKLGLLLALFGAAGVIAAGLAGWAVARNGLRPVRALTEAAEDIARTEQLDPIEVEGNDEIARLARAFNTMLAALSASRDRQRQLVADAGHELRTPLTSLRTNLELLTQADRQGGLSDASRTELLADVRFQIEELTNLIGDLTELARAQPARVLLERVDLADVIERAVQRVRRRASTLHFDLRVEPWWVIGEAAGLERAVTNLLDNAAKWSPAHGVVTVTLSNGLVTVADQGQGIAEEDLPHVFDRFYRSPAARPLPGSGLGLSIVRQVAERHGGLVRVGHAPGGGAQFEMFLPGTPAPPAPPGEKTSEMLEHGPGTGRSQGTLSGG